MIDEKYYLAEINIALMRAPLDDPIMADFVNNLESINALADSAPGFVWRLQTEAGDATSLRVFENEYIIVNMSVWESIDTLFTYVYGSDHTNFFRRRAEWFQKLDMPVLVLWWIPAGHIPTVEEAKARLEYLRERGPTPLAFTFKRRFTIEQMLEQTQQNPA